MTKEEYENLIRKLNRIIELLETLVGIRRLE